MAKTKKNLKEDLKGMKPGELEKKLAFLQEEMRVIKFKAEGSRSKNVKELLNLKRQIARVLTEINKVNK
jgi:ribosomal protein L29